MLPEEYAYMLNELSRFPPVNRKLVQFFEQQEWRLPPMWMDQAKCFRIYPDAQRLVVVLRGPTIRLQLITEVYITEHKIPVLSDVKFDAWINEYGTTTDYRKGSSWAYSKNVESVYQLAVNTLRIS